jgi:serine/threonine-protein kinase
MNFFLKPGTNIGHYEIRAQLGAGGMGEVYRAHDVRLNRDVAIKILPHPFHLDRDRLSRFQREAHVLATLNHPNIAAIYGLEEQNGLRGLVLELVEGPTVADRIAHGPVPVHEAITIARQIAEALEVAHERGIIHRDLKPANVKVTDAGVVKVLDFGLAKVFTDEPSAEDVSSSPTLLKTDVGVILGTAAYMSPEQAKGQAVDKRADIWAFGCVLFEMLSGKRAFSGETFTDTLAAVVTAEPNWNTLPSETPTRIQGLLRRCLTKDPKQRLRDIGDAEYELDNQQLVQSEIRRASEARRYSWRLPALIAVVTMVTFAAGWFLSRLFSSRGSTTPPIIRLTYTVNSNPSGSGFRRNRIAISPDGAKLVYVADYKLYLRSLDSLETKEIPGGRDARGPFFSPDGQWIGFMSAPAIKKLPVNGGTPVFICSAGDTVGGSWGPDNTILIGGNYSGVLRVSANGGKPETIVKPTPGLSYAHPQFLPDGTSFLYQRGKPGMVADNELIIRSLASEDEKVILRGGFGFRYVRSGHIVYAVNRTSNHVDLAAVPFDLNSRQVTGPSVNVISDVELSISGGNTPQFFVSEAGTLVYVRASPTQSRGTRLVVVSASGQPTEIPAEPRDYSDPRVSPDGRFVAAHLLGDQDDIWVTDVVRGTLVRLSYDAGEDETPAWSPDGKVVAWAGSRANLLRGIFRRPADGTGTEELIWQLENHAHVRDWTPDGRSLVIEGADAYMGTNIWRLDLGSPPSAKVFLQTQFNERCSRLSPDGHWLAYKSDESGRDEIYVQSFPQAGSKVQVSTTGGDQPVWSHDGKKIFFRSDGAFQGDYFAPGSPPTVSKARFVFKDTFDDPQANTHTAYDVFPDGRFVMIQPTNRSDTAEVVVVVNWLEELKRLVPTNK